MDGVPYPQPLAGPVPQYVPWGVLLVRPIGHPPRPVPPRAADQRSRAYPTLLRVLRWGRYGHRGGPQTPEVGSLAGAPRGPFSSRPPFRCAVCGGWCPVSPGWGGGGGGGGCSLFLAVLLAGVSPPPLVLRCWCVVCGVWVCGVRWWCVGGVVGGVWCGWSLATPGGGSRVLLPATPGWVLLPVVVGGPRHSWLGSAGGGGVWCVAVVCWLLVPRHSWRRFLCATPRHSWLGFAAGGGGRSPPLLAGVRWRRWCVACGGGVLVVGPSPLLAEVPVCYSPPLLAGFRCRRWCVVCGVWCAACGVRRWRVWWVCGWCVVGPSPLLAEVPVCYSPPLLAGFRCRWWWAVPATPGWGPLAAVVCGVWRWCVGCWSLATPGGGSCVLLPATPGWVWLPVVVGGPRHSWLGSAGGGGVWCVAVVCWLLVPRHSWRRFLCATPRHSWLGFAAGGGAWCAVCGVQRVACGGGVCGGFVAGVVGPSPLLAEVPVCYSPPLLAGFRCRWWWAVPATPGWGPLAAVVCGVWRWCVGCWSLATPGGGSCVLPPPLLAGFRCRWWWAVPATPGWGPLAAVVCGVWRWCVGCWSLATPGGGSCVLLPATPG